MKQPEAEALLDQIEALVNKAFKTKNKRARKTFLLRASIETKTLLDDFLSRYLGYLPDYKKQSARRSLLSTAGLYETKIPAPDARSNPESVQSLSPAGINPGADTSTEEKII